MSPKQITSNLLVDPKREPLKERLRDPISPSKKREVGGGPYDLGATWVHGRTAEVRVLEGSEPSNVWGFRFAWI